MCPSELLFRNKQQRYIPTKRQVLSGLSLKWFHLGKLMCPKHSDAKQTEMLEFGAEKGLLQGHARRWVSQALKSLKLPKAKHF